MTKIHRVLGSVVLAISAGACAPDEGHGTDREPAQPTPTQTVDGLTPSEVEALFNDAVGLALAGAPGVTATRSDDAVVLDGTVVLGAGDVAFDAFRLEKRPFSPRGGATVVSEGALAALSFAGAVEGELAIDGAAAGSVTAAFPMTAEFGEAAAEWAVDTALSPGASFADPCPNLTVTDNGNGSFTIDGDCAIAGATVSLDMVTIDLANLSITGSITVDDGNGNTVLVQFNGDTLDVTVNGTLVVDDEPIFGFLP